MMYTPYDWNQAVAQRLEFIEERIRDGSPVVAMSLPEGVLMLTVHQVQRKLFEIYDRIMFGGIGNQSDLETVRNAAIDYAHREGFQRSPDDVTLQRLVGTALSPAVKRAFNEPYTAPFVARSLFAELGDAPAEDRFYALNYDGEYSLHPDFAVVAGSAVAENEMTRLVHEAMPRTGGLEAGLRLALDAWAAGKAHVGGDSPDEDTSDTADGRTDPSDVLRAELATGTVEAALLERGSRRESKFRLLENEVLEPVVGPHRG